MTDTTPPPRSNYPATGSQETDKDAPNVGRNVEDKARNVGKRISDAVEDVIPGDSDHDGH